MLPGTKPLRSRYTRRPGPSTRTRREVATARPHGPGRGAAAERLRGGATEPRPGALVEADQDVLDRVGVGGRIGAAHERFAVDQGEGVCCVQLCEAAVQLVLDVQVAVCGPADERVVARRVDDVRVILARVLRDAGVYEEADAGANSAGRVDADFSVASELALALRCTRRELAESPDPIAAKDVVGWRARVGNVMAAHARRGVIRAEAVKRVEFGE
jgi:hypothetical protein